MKKRLVSVVLDEKTIARKNASVDHERAVAIFDLVDDNCFEVNGCENLETKLILSLQEHRLVFEVFDHEDTHLVTHALSLTPFKRVVKDYFIVCDSYYTAIKTMSPSQIEAIDMGRRGLHNEGSDLLKERLSEKLFFDFETSRRLFTLIATLIWKG